MGRNLSTAVYVNAERIYSKISVSRWLLITGRDSNKPVVVIVNTSVAERGMGRAGVLRPVNVVSSKVLTTDDEI